MYTTDVQMTMLIAAQMNFPPTAVKGVVRASNARARLRVYCAAAIIIAFVFHRYCCCYRRCRFRRRWLLSVGMAERRGEVDLIKAP